MKNIIKICIISTLYLGCQINGSFKGLTSYRNELDDGLESTASNELFSCSIKYSNYNKLSIINGLMLKECISMENAVLVYIWQPNCKSEACIDLNALQKICNLNNVTLFVVAEYYDLKKMNKIYNIEKPIFGIDTYYYETDLTKKYIKYFLTDLIGKNLPKNSNFIYFKKGNHIDSLKYIDDISLLYEI